MGGDGPPTPRKDESRRKEQEGSKARINDRRRGPTVSRTVMLGDGIRERSGGLFSGAVPRGRSGGRSDNCSEDAAPRALAVWIQAPPEIKSTPLENGVRGSQLCSTMESSLLYRAAKRNKSACCASRQDVLLLIVRCRDVFEFGSTPVAPAFELSLQCKCGPQRKPRETRNVGRLPMPTPCKCPSIHRGHGIRRERPGTLSGHCDPMPNPCYYDGPSSVLPRRHRRRRKL